MALLKLITEGKIRGTVHTCLGQEACAVGVIGALNKDVDVIFSNHRGHGHYLAYSNDVEGLLAEVMGKPSGVCNGIGGSQHLQYKNFYTNGIQGAGVPIATGMALAEKYNNTNAIAVSMLGDGTFGEGAVYEAFNIAALWEVPILYVVEFNHYAQSTPSSQQHAGDLRSRAKTFGIPVTSVDGMDVLCVYEEAKKAIQRVRKDKKPELLFLETYRLGPHSKGDDHRDTQEIERFRKRDPIILLKERLDPDVYLQIYDKTHDKVKTIVEELSHV